MPQPDLNPLPPANTQEPPEASSPEELTPMLDVHPAHHAASTWRDFFIHIATIVIGLLIAIGLEQTVEYFHHRHLASEARSNSARNGRRTRSPTKSTSTPRSGTNAICGVTSPSCTP
jgi:hypothetical protein